MKKYTVKDIPIMHDGKRYEVGEIIELDDQTAAGIADLLDVVDEENDDAEAKAKAEAEAEAKAPAKKPATKKTTG